MPANPTQHTCSKKMTCTHFFMGREDGEARAGWLVLLGCLQGPEGNGTATKLRKPRFQLRLGRIMGQTGHVENLAALRKKGPDIGAGIHWLAQHIGMFLGGLRLANQAAQDTSKGDSFFNCASRRSRGEGLQVERKIVLYGRA